MHDPKSMVKTRLHKLQMGRIRTTRTRPKLEIRNPTHNNKSPFSPSGMLLTLSPMTN
ncbi:hypothetical protein HanIR_Chr11g0533721 [Helianthus annuus]|nr:hypothetical protein HanIR_Chr11g0533721 [Helianthus annuus]